MSAEPPVPVTREQQAELDPILDAAAEVDGLAGADRIMAAYLLGRRHEAAT